VLGFTTEDDLPPLPTAYEWFRYACAAFVFALLLFALIGGIVPEVYDQWFWVDQTELGPPWFHCLPQDCEEVRP
jgi:hypothetical protein